MSINIMVGAGILFAVGAMTELAGATVFWDGPWTASFLFPIIWGLSLSGLNSSRKGGFFQYCSMGIPLTAALTSHSGAISLSLTWV